MTKSYEDRMIQAVKHLENEYVNVRAGRANPGILDKVTVEYYGSDTPINQVASIGQPDARTLTITPWDRSLLKKVTKAIQVSEIGINPVDDGSCIRLVFPAPTEERRKALQKDVSKMAEEAKVAVRNVRRDTLDKLKTLKKNNEITEDDMKDIEKDVQKVTDTFCDKVDDVISAKEKEIMSI